MHPRHLHLLCCPITGDSLSLNADRMDAHGMVISGSLHTPAGASYPIVRGVPRFVGSEHYAASFGYEWSRWPRVQFESENVGRPMEGHTTRMWERITGATDEQVRAKTILDFGCGPGRFLDVVRRKGGVAVGIDLSAAVDCARQNFADDPDVLIVQGDLFRPPFRPGTFDGGFSIGVLHHTPEPARGLETLAGLVGPLGWVSCCVYPKGDFYDFPSVRRLRTAHLRLRGVFGYRFAMAYSYFAAYALAPLVRRAKKLGLRGPMQYVERNWLVSLYLKDARWRVLDTFDAITPEIASTHTTDEVRQWLENARCRNVRTTPWCPTSLSGVRAA
ncbi:MAG: Methyltransferase type 11 [Phycisphaerales bacterium]|nr:Methyltransferase type 11 [Phycisphaerales bacterium]